jgi:hypothetical protein
MSDPGAPRSYSQEEVNEILKRALRQQSLQKKTLSHDELVEMASEVGIDRESLEAATADLAQSREAEIMQHESARELAEERARRFSRFVYSLLTYLIVGVFLYFIDMKTGGGTWYFWPILGFAIALAFQVRGIVFPQEGLARRKRREEKEAKRRERREMREAMRQRVRASFSVPPAQAINAGAKEFESAVQTGVAALLTVAARKIQAQADRSLEDDRRRDAARRRDEERRADEERLRDASRAQATRRQRT